MYLQYANKATRHLIVIALFIIVATFSAMFIFTSQANAAMGSSGSGSGGSSSVGHWTKYGFGWKKFSKNGSGPSAGFQSGSWSSVKAACSGYASDYIWIHVVRSSAGKEKSFNYHGAPYNRNRPYAGLDPYMFNANGASSPQGAAYQQKVINIVAKVRAAFRVAHSQYDSKWGVSVGWFCDGPQSTPWTIAAESYIKKVGPSAPSNSETGYNTANITAIPGDRINFKHEITARSANIDKRVYYTIRSTGFPSSFGQSPPILINGDVGPTIAKDSLFVHFGNYSGADSRFMAHTVTQDDVGKDLCQRIEWQPLAWNNSGAGASQYRCVSVPYNYTLTPSVSSDASSVVESQQEVTVRPIISNPGPTKSPSVAWRLTRIVVSPGGTVPNPSGGESATDPCGSYFRNSTTSCSVVASGSSVVSVSGLNLPNYTDRIEDFAIGTRICYGLSVRPFSQNSSQWMHSAPSDTCAVVGKKPKVQVWGGDLLVGRIFTGSSLPTSISLVEASISTKSEATPGSEAINYGSWIEYGIFAPNYVNGVASGSGLNGGSVNSQSGWSKLTFSNDQTNSSVEPCASGAIPYGCFPTQSSSLPDVVSNFPVSASTPRITGAVSTDVLPSGLSTVNDGDNIVIELTGGTINRGKWHVINAPNATVNVTGDIVYTTDILNDASEIPQLVIIAKDINIAGNVRQVDAWLVAAGGSVVTCSDRGTARDLRTVSVTSMPNAYKLAGRDCVNTLFINGPVIAESLWLRRTAGSGVADASGDPSEVINLRPDAYLWAAEISKRTPRAQTVFILENAPRL
jgi:hypothetical protein